MHSKIHIIGDPFLLKIVNKIMFNGLLGNQSNTVNRGYLDPGGMTKNLFFGVSNRL